MKNILFLLAVVCWLLSLAVNLACVTNYNIIPLFKFMYPMHLTIFIVWFPAILLLRNNPKVQLLKRNNNASLLTFLKMFFTGVPVWVIAIVIACYANTLYNIARLVFTDIALGNVTEIGGQYILSNHGSFIKFITVQEYKEHIRVILLTFSSAWMVFHGMAVVLLYPGKATTI